MFSSLTIWFRNLWRPKVTTVYVQLYENGRELDISTYSDIYLASLTKAIDTFFVVEKKSPYWFETEVFEQSSCFQKKPTLICATCYSHDITTDGFKRPFPIPIKYRKKLLDTTHTIKPEPVGSKSWPGRMEVRFRLTKG